MALARIVAPLRFHRRLPGYEETPLVDAPKLAEALGVGKVFVKDESSRLGLPAFKVLGASWAVYRALEERLGDEGFGDWEEIGELKGATRTLAAALARRGHRRQPRARRGTGGAATGTRGEDLRSRWHGPGAPQVHRRRGRRGDRGRWNLRRGRRALGRGRRRERAPGLGHVLARLRAYTSLGDRRLLDDAVGDRRRAGEEKRRRTRPRGRAGRRRRLRRRRGPPLPQPRGVVAPEAHERRAGERGLPARSRSLPDASCPCPGRTIPSCLV